MCTPNTLSNELTNSCDACQNKCAPSHPPQAETSFELDGLSALQHALARTLRLIESSRLNSIAQDDKTTQLRV